MKFEISGKKMLRFIGLRRAGWKIKRERRQIERDTLDTLSAEMNKLQRGVKKQETHMEIKEGRLAKKVLDLQIEIEKAAEERLASENIARNMQILLQGRVAEEQAPIIDVAQIEAAEETSP